MTINDKNDIIKLPIMGAGGIDEKTIQRKRWIALKEGVHGIFSDLSYNTCYYW